MNKLTVLYFYHLPKCGGTYVMRLLRVFQKALHADFVSFNNWGQHPKEPDADQKQAHFFRSLKDYDANKVVLIHHHHGYPGVHDLYEHLLAAKQGVLKQGGQIAFITMVREPISRLTSMVNFRKKMGNADANFEEMISNPNFWDRMTKYFLFNQKKRGIGGEVQINELLLKKNIQLFDKIFTLDQIDLLINFLNDFLGTTDISLDKKVNTSEWKIIPTEAQKEEYLANIFWDSYFYDLVKQHGPDVDNILLSRS